MNKIKVMSRYQEPRYFEKVDEGYIYFFEDKYCRIGMQENNIDYHFVDPSGGPFISVKYDLQEVHPNLEGIVKKIEYCEKGYKLILE